MIAILGGLGAALCFATGLLGSTRASRLIGAWSTLAWVMLIGLAITVPLVAIWGSGARIGADELALLAGSGLSNVVGLSAVYTAVRIGKVAVIGPIVSTEGAIAAVIAVLAGEPIASAALVVLAAIAVGVVLAATERRATAVVPAGSGREPATTSLLAVGLAVVGAACFGVNLFLSARIADAMPLAWAILPARAAGVLLVALPLALTRRLRLTREAAPFVAIVGIAEVVGIASFSLGSRDSIAVTAVLASQFAGISTIAAVILYGERLSRLQVAGVVTIAAGVAVLSWLRAASLPG